MNIEIKIKMDNGNKVVLDESEAKELLAKLKMIFEPVVISYPPNRPYEVWYSTTT